MVPHYVTFCFGLEASGEGLAVLGCYAALSGIEGY